MLSGLGVPTGPPEILFAVLAGMLGGGALVVVRFSVALTSKR